MLFMNVLGRTPVLWGGSVTVTGLSCVVVVLLLVCSVLQVAGWWIIT
jgi:hypothetical protein